MKCSLVIPTYQRCESLTLTVGSVLDGARMPDELLIIDDAALPVELVEEYRRQCNKKKVSFVYHKKDHAVHRQGLSESKNLAALLVQHEVVLYIDDDVVLESEYIAALMHEWEQQRDGNLFAIGGKITNNRAQPRLEKALYNKLFGLTGDSHWDVNDVGFQVWDESISASVRGHYMHGGVSSYRTELLLQYPFKVFSGGRTGNEDVEQALRIKRAGYHMLYAPTARLAHYHATQGREAAYNSGVKESRSRKEIFALHCKQDRWHRLWFAWATVGWLLRKVLTLQWRYAYGMVRGLF